MAVVLALAAAAVAYVVLRAGFIFGGLLVAVVAVVLAALATVAWRRGRRSVAAGLVAGAALSAAVLAL